MSEESDPKFIEMVQKYAATAMKHVPYADAMGMEIIDIQKGRAIAKAPYNPDLVGDPDTGVIHGGVITALLDNIAGVSVFSALRKPMSTATLDLRIDYMRPATPNLDIYGEAECYHFTRTVAFVRGWAYHESKEKVIATAAGAFALNDFNLSGMARKIEKVFGDE